MERLFKNALLSFFMVSILFACSEKDDEEVATAGKLIGVWTYSSSEVSMTINDKSIKDYYREEFGLTEEQAQEMEDQFTEDNEYLETVFTMEFKADKKYIMMDTDDETSEGSWELSSDGKTLTIDGEEVIIKTATSSKLSIIEEYSQESDINGDSNNELIKISAISHFSK